MTLNTRSNSCDPTALDTTVQGIKVDQAADSQAAGYGLNKTTNSSDSQAAGN